MSNYEIETFSEVIQNKNYYLLFFKFLILGKNVKQIIKNKYAICVNL